MRKDCFIYSRSQKGFALGEVLVSLFIVSIVVSTIGLLANQVMRLQKASKQAGTLVDFRMKTASIANDTERWLGKLKSSAELSGLYERCIPSSDNSFSVSYDCPAKENALYKAGNIEDEGLRKAATGFTAVTSTKIVDAAGELFAGTITEPHHLDAGGAACTHADKSKCDLRSTGYFMRENVNGNPGAVSFVVKIEKNNIEAGSTPLKPQYIKMDVGTSWNKSKDQCSSTSIKLGINTDGTPYCVSTTAGCPTGEVAIGVKANGTPNCSPAPSCQSGSFVTIQDGKLTCKQATNPCPDGSAHLGYYSATSAPICASSLAGCPDKKIQTGINVSGNTVTPVCNSLPTIPCSADEVLSFDGTDFKCKKSIVVSSCPSGKVAVGINPDGSVKCETPNTNLSSNSLTCSTGKYVSGLQPDGTVICNDLPNTNTNTNTNVATGLVIAKFGSGIKCKDPTNFLIACGNYPKGVQAFQDASYNMCYSKGHSIHYGWELEWDESKKGYFNNNRSLVSVSKFPMDVYCEGEVNTAIPRNHTVCVSNQVGTLGNLCCRVENDTGIVGCKWQQGPGLPFSIINSPFPNNVGPGDYSLILTPYGVTVYSLCRIEKSTGAMTCMKGTGSALNPTWGTSDAPF